MCTCGLQVHVCMHVHVFVLMSAYEVMHSDVLCDWKQARVCLYACETESLLERACASNRVRESACV